MYKRFHSYYNIFGFFFAFLLLMISLYKKYPANYWGIRYFLALDFILVFMCV
jgi:hypothetical protein